MFNTICQLNVFTGMILLLEGVQMFNGWYDGRSLQFLKSRSVYHDVHPSKFLKERKHEQKKNNYI